MSYLNSVESNVLNVRPVTLFNGEERIRIRKSEGENRGNINNNDDVCVIKASTETQTQNGITEMSIMMMIMDGKMIFLALLKMYFKIIMEIIIT